MQNASTLFIYLFYSSIETSPTKYKIIFPFLIDFLGRKKEVRWQWTM